MEMVAKALAFIFFIACGVLVAGLLQERYLHMKTKSELHKTKQELVECNAKLELQNAQIESLKVDYEKKIKEFKKQASKVKKIYEPLKIEIPQTTDECQALKEMLDKYKEVEMSLP